MIFPANPEECFTMARDAFDLAERFQTPTFVVMDLDIGMNDWMCKRFTWDDSYRPDRGKVLDEAALEKVEKFYRYVSTNGDGVAARTLPGRRSQGLVLHARVGPHEVRHVHRRRGRIPRGDGSPRAQDRRRGGGGAGAGNRRRATAHPWV